MKLIQISIAIGATILAFGCADQGAKPDTSTYRVIATAELTPSRSAVTGQANLESNGQEARISLKVNGLPEGAHGFHLHETGVCEGPDFKSAGGHLNPLRNSHGTLSDRGSHLGDLPNLDFNADGRAGLTATLAGSPKQLEEWIFDGDGTAIVIHESADDYKTDPSGDAGSRVACGILKPV